MAQAFLTITFFDERFNFIPAADGGVAQQQVAATVGSNGSSLTLANVKAPKNRYAYVYISNQSNNHVYFDDMQVHVTAGNIIEENHYYAYGLRIAAISSRKAGNGYEGMLRNNYLYNDKELFEEADLNWYDYGFRFYDPQIGRFPQLDPLTFEYPYYTPYQFAGCEPIANIDVDGLEPANVVNAVTKLVKEGASNITANVITTGGKNFGKWAVSWGKDGMVFSKVFKSTGFLVERVANAATHLLNVANIASNTSNVLVNPPAKGDLDQTFGVTNDSRQIAMREYTNAVNNYEAAVEKAWHRQYWNNNLQGGYPEGELVNDITGQRKLTPTAITPVYPETTILLPMPKVGSAVFKLILKSKATKTGGSTPSFIVSKGGTAFPVPKGATGPFPASSGKGIQFIEGVGGNGLSPKATGFRFMDPVTTGKFQYPGGYGSYFNKAGQTINPFTGQTISPSNPWWHIPAK